MARIHGIPLLGALLCCGALSGHAQAADADWMFDPATVVEIDLSLPQESEDALADDPYEYQPGSFSLTTAGTTYGPLEVGIRLKGQLGSFRPLSEKAAFKLKFSHVVSGQRFLGLKGLTLNNMVQDPSMIHEVLAYEAFQAAGVAAPGTGYAYVRVNGADYGLYLNLETPDDVWLPRWFDSTQHLYEGEAGVDVVRHGAGAFEVDEGEEEDVSDLEALIAAANRRGDFSKRVAGIADLDQMTLMWAVERYIGHRDGYSTSHNNYFLHSDEGGKFRMLPWGTDQTWAPHKRVRFGGGSALLFDRCRRDPSCARRYRRALVAARSAIVAADLDALAATTASALEPWQALDPRRPYSLAEIASEVDTTRVFIASRPASLERWLSRSARGG